MGHGSERGCRSGSSPHHDAPAVPARCGCRGRLPGGASQTSGEIHPHTAHESSALRISYRHHPFFGSAIQVVRTLRRTHADIVLISLPDGLQIAIPRWMLDPVACDQLPAEDRARIGLSALRDLRALLDSHPLSGAGSMEDAGVTRSPGGHDAQAETEPGPPTAVALSG